MITVYSGIPGSGKSYLMVKDLLSVAGKKFIIHNIDGLNPHCLKKKGFDFTEYCAKEGLEVEQFFSKEVQGRICEEVEKKHGLQVLVIVDESHEWFDRHVKSLKMWLSYHRHLGQDIWLVAHRASNLPQVYRSFVESEVRAKTSSLIYLPGFFMYQKLAGGESCGWSVAKKDPVVFSQYKSQSTGAPSKKKSFFIPIMVLLMIGGLYAFLKFPTWIYGKEKPPVASMAGPTSKSKGQIDATSSGLPSGVMPVADVAAVVPPSLADSWAYVGQMGERHFFENRGTGEQLPDSRLPGRFAVIGSYAPEWCEVMNLDTSEISRLVNSGRRRERAEGRSEQAPPVEFSQKKKLDNL